MTGKRSFTVFLSTILTRAIYNVTYVSVIWKLCFDKNNKITLQRHISTQKQFKDKRVSRRLTSIHTSRCHKHLPSLALKFRVVIKSGVLYPAPLCENISGCRFSLVRGLVWLPDMVVIGVYSNRVSVERNLLSNFKGWDLIYGGFFWVRSSFYLRIYQKVFTLIFK